MNQPERQDKKVQRAIERVNMEEHAAMLGTPVGLRGLFPTNHVRMRTRTFNLHEMQRIIMTAKKDKPIQSDNTVASPADSATDAMRAPIDAAGRDLTKTLEDDPNASAEGTEGGPVGTAITDPGPPPKMPEYNGTTYSATVDQLMMAAGARDADAVRAVSTRNAPPAVAQYKANLLQWLTDLDTHEANQAIPRAEQGIDPDAAAQDDGDRDFGRNDGGGPA